MNAARLAIVKSIRSTTVACVAAYAATLTDDEVIGRKDFFKKVIAANVTESDFAARLANSNAGCAKADALMSERKSAAHAAARKERRAVGAFAINR